MSHKDITPQAEEKIREYSALGWNNRRIGLELSIQPAVIGEYLSANPELQKIRTDAARASGPKHTTATKDLEPKQAMMVEMIDLLEQGVPMQDIAKSVGVSTATVRKHLNRFYAAHFEKNRSQIAGSQYADIQMIKEELLEFILKDAGDELKQFMAQVQAQDVDLDDQAQRSQIIEKAFNKGRKSFDTKAKAMEVFLKYLDREAKLSGVDAAANVNVNHRVKIEPQAIELLQRIQQTHEISDAIEGEVVENFDSMGGDF